MARRGGFERSNNVQRTLLPQERAELNEAPGELARTPTTSNN